MKLTSEMIKKRAEEIGLDDVGIASIDRFEGAPPLMNPKSYFPEARSVIVTVQRVPRGTYRGIEEGTHWHNYTYYSYNRLNTFFRPLRTYRLACFVEDHGWEAVPCYPSVPERNPVSEPVREGGLPPNICTSVRIQGVGAGVGEMGWSKVFINPKFGPRVRLGSILTDAELTPDPVIEPGTLCVRCGRCVRECPGNAIPPIGEENAIHIEVGGRDISWGDVNMGRCTLTHHGQNNRISPFHKEAFPHMAFDVENSDMTEEEAYRMCYPLASAGWSPTFRENDPCKVIPFYAYMMNHVEYFAICGARGCIRACMDTLEKAGRIGNTFHNPFYRKQSWLLPNAPETRKGRVNGWREEYLDERFPGRRKNEY